MIRVGVVRTEYSLMAFWRSDWDIVVGCDSHSLRRSCQFLWGSLLASLGDVKDIIGITAVL